MGSRRNFLRATTGVIQTAAGAALLTTVPIPPAYAAVPIRETLRETFGPKPINEGKVELTLPSLSENGNSVSLDVAVDSPMTPEDHVQSIHILSAVNPLPVIAVFQLSPACGTARIATRIRLADTQSILAVATMNDGSLWSGSAATVVTLAACIDTF